MSWSVAENSKAGICFLTGLSVLAELSYDMLVVNRSREPYTHQGQTHLTTLYLLHSTFPRNFLITCNSLRSDSAVLSSVLYLLNNELISELLTPSVLAVFHKLHMTFGR